MTTSIAAQLQALKSAVKGDAEPLKKPFTRPSILFNRKDAADINIDTIYSIALSGLEILISKEERFRNYKSTLFSHKSKELDRELMGIEQNKQINDDISSYLRLLSDHFELLAARRTLEYLIRRYKIHVYNAEELILCTLPYHDTHDFVRVVQLLDTGNGRWKFLDGVKSSGAPPPRKVIAQQCMRDLGVLYAICEYARSKKIQPSTAAGFCTAIMMEVLGSSTIVNSAALRIILQYVVSGLESSPRDKPQLKAGALMIVGLMAQKVTLTREARRTLIRLVVVVAQDSAKQSNDLQWVRLSLMALINIIQFQSLREIPRNCVDILVKIRRISEVLGGLTEEFKIDKFLTVFLDSLLLYSSEYSFADPNYRCTLMSLLGTVPLKLHVDRVVSKLLEVCSTVTKNTDLSNASESVRSQPKEILVSLHTKYPMELRQAIHKVLQNTEVQSGKDGSKHEILSRILDGDGDLSLGFPDSKTWFGLEHPKAEVRRSALTRLDVGGLLSFKVDNSKMLDIVQDAMLRRLQDDDLAVVQAALDVQNLDQMISPSILLDTIQSVLNRCIQILLMGASTETSLASKVAVSCLQLSITSFKDQDEFMEQLAAMIFPLVLILPKTQRVNLKALELAKELKWPFYTDLIGNSTSEKKVGLEHISSVNLDNISKLAENFRLHHEELIPLLLECSSRFQQSKTLLFLILLQSFMVPKLDFIQFSVLYDASFPILQREWEMLESAGKIAFAEESKSRMVDGDCRRFVERLPDNNVNELNPEILVCLFWRFVEAFIITSPDNEKNAMWFCKLKNLYVFFASRSSQLFKKHLHHLVNKCKSSLSEFLSKLFTEEGVSSRVQVESLHSFVHLCSQSDENLGIQVLSQFPSVLVLLASNDQDARMAAFSCIEGLFSVWSRVNFSRCKNGNSAVLVHFLGEFFGLMVQQKKLILSDQNVLPSIFKSLLSSSTDSLLVQPNIGKRFDASIKDEFLDFLLDSAVGLSPYAKLKVLSMLKGLGTKVIEVNGVKSLLDDLLERRFQYHVLHSKLSQKLSKTDVDILCLLLEICTMPTLPVDRGQFDDLVLVKALEINGSISEDPAVVEPCITLMKNLNNSLFGCLKAETQEILFRHLVVLFHSGNADLQNYTREALLRINIRHLVVCKMLDFAAGCLNASSGSAAAKKKKKPVTDLDSDMLVDLPQRGENALSFLGSLLDILMLKKNMENRSSLLGSLFKLLRLIFMSDEGVFGPVDAANKNVEASSVVFQTVSKSRVYIQQTLLLILEDITSSIINDSSEQVDVSHVFDLELLVKCASMASDAVTFNHVLSLFSTIAKLTPEKVLDHILDILKVIGEYAVRQWDSYSQRVFEDVISAAVPFWLSKTDDIEKLLQIFVHVLPQVSQHQRLSIMLCLLRNVGESRSFGSLLFLMFRSLVSNESLFKFSDGEPSVEALISVINTKWEYLSARQLSAQYSCRIWLPSLVMLLQRIGTSPIDEQHYVQLVVAMQFVLEKLKDPEISFLLDSGEDIDSIQMTLGALMEQVICLMEQLNARKKQIGVSLAIKNGLKDLIRVVLKTIAERLVPLSYFRVIIQLLRHADKNVRKKAFGLLSEKLKESGTTSKIRVRRQSKRSLGNSWLHLDENALISFDEMCLEMLKLVDVSDDDSGCASLKLAAISTLEVLAYRFPLDNPIFGMCLKSVSKNIRSTNSVVSSSCLRATSALIYVLGPRALSELPRIMECIFSRSRDISVAVAEESKIHDVSSITFRNTNGSVFFSVLVALEAVIDRLGGFLNPYLGDILELSMLHPWYAFARDDKLSLKADVVRKLLTDKIPVRLLLPPLLRVYTDAVKCGGSSVSVVFEMLQNMVTTMDRSAISAYHVQIFDLGLLALDLRCQHPDLIKEIHNVEDKVISSMVSLTMKLTETMFKPLFVKSIEWSGSYIDERDGIQRAISFYALVNKLAESHRSLFVPYFKYLIDGFVHHLNEDTQVSVTRKKKKVKLQVAVDEKRDSGVELSVELWHLRALVISSLHKCFLYDTGSLKFLDTSNFQVLLKPIVSQLVKDPPPSLEQHPDVPSIKEVDDSLVDCIGQMAVTAASDLLWKPLNHEVLLHTRSEKVRARILGLRIVRNLVENLKEEYLVFLPETIPFLGELLEDVELPVKALAQEILKEMEFMSGESLQQYL